MVDQERSSRRWRRSCARASSWVRRSRLHSVRAHWFHRGPASPPGALAGSASGTMPLAASEAGEEVATYQAVLDRYCVTCHNGRTLAGGLALDDVDLGRVGPDAKRWEKVLQKLHTRAMPPPRRPRPEPAVYDAFAAWLEGSLDQWVVDHPNPGRPPIHPTQPPGVRQRGARPAAPGDRRPSPPARRRYGVRLRQQRRHPHRRARVVLALHVRRARRQPPRRRRPRDRGGRRALSGVAAARAGRPHGRGPAVRLARRRRGAAPLPAGRRLRAAHRVAPEPGAQRAPGDRRPGGRRARRPAARGPLARRRAAGVAGRPRCGRGSRRALPGARGDAAGVGLVHGAADDPRGRGAGPPAALDVLDGAGLRPSRWPSTVSRSRGPTTGRRRSPPGRPRAPPPWMPQVPPLSRLRASPPPRLQVLLLSRLRPSPLSRLRGAPPPRLRASSPPTPPAADASSSASPRRRPTRRPARRGSSRRWRGGRSAGR